MKLDELVVELILKSDQFNKAQKAALAAFFKAGEEAGKTGKKIEDSGKKSAEAIEGVAKGALGLFAIFLGARGLKDFAAHLIHSDSALGRFAANIGASSDMASAWGLAAERMGGSAEATGASVQGLYDRLWRMKRLGEVMPTEYFMLAARGGVNLDRTKDTYSQLFQLATAIQNIAKKEGRAEAATWGRMIGLDEGTVNTIIESGNKLREHIEEIRKSIAPRPKDIEASQRLQNAWHTLSQQATSLGRQVQTALSPAFSSIVGGMSAWLQKNQEFFDQRVGENLKPIATELNNLSTWLTGRDGQYVLWFFDKLSNLIGGTAQTIGALLSVVPQMAKDFFAFTEDNKLNRALGYHPEKGYAPQRGEQLGYFGRMRSRWFNRKGDIEAPAEPQLGEPQPAVRWQDLKRRLQGMREAPAAPPPVQPAWSDMPYRLGASPVTAPPKAEANSWIEQLAKLAKSPGYLPPAPGTARTEGLPAPWSSLGTYGAGLAAALSNPVANYNGDTSNAVHIGSLHIATAASDPDVIARDMAAALQRSTAAMMFNSGPQ